MKNGNESHNFIAPTTLKLSILCVDSFFFPSYRNQASNPTLLLQTKSAHTMESTGQTSYITLITTNTTFKISSLCVDPPFSSYRTQASNLTLLLQSKSALTMESESQTSYIITNTTFKISNLCVNPPLFHLLINSSIKYTQRRDKRGSYIIVPWAPLQCNNEGVSSFPDHSHATSSSALWVCSGNEVCGASDQ